MEKGPVSISIFHRESKATTEANVGHNHGTARMHVGNKTAGVDVDGDDFFLLQQEADQRRGPYCVPTEGTSIHLDIGDDFGVEVTHLPEG